LSRLYFQIYLAIKVENPAFLYSESKIFSVQKAWN